MKKLFMLLSVVGALTFASCGEGGGHDDGHDADTTAVEETSDADATIEAEEGKELAAHVCNDKCTPEECHKTCGEEGHECSEACHKAHEGGEEGDAEAAAEEEHAEEGEAH